MPMNTREHKSPDSFPDKREARSWARALLSSTAPEDRAGWSAAAAAEVAALEAFRRSDLVLAFLSMPSEIDTTQVIRGAFRDGKRVAAPRMEGGDIVFALLDDSWESMPRDAMGIPTPPAGKTLALDEMARRGVFVLVPGLLFDRFGGRLGRGKGYYDRFLGAALAAMSSRTSKSGSASRGGFFVPCGFCYETQLVNRVPTDEGDIRLPLVATDAGIHRVGENQTA